MDGCREEGWKGEESRGRGMGEERRVEQGVILSAKNLWVRHSRLPAVNPRYIVAPLIILLLQLLEGGVLNIFRVHPVPCLDRHTVDPYIGQVYS